MKQPTCTSIDGTDYQGHAIETCYECGTEWPCKTWRRWTKSKDYRIAELEAAVKRLAGQVSSRGEQLRKIEKTVRDDSNILRNGIFRAVADVGRHNRMGNLTLDWTRDAVDITPAGSAWRELEAGPSELTVTYEAIDGRTWTNGAVTEQTLNGG